MEQSICLECNATSEPMLRSDFVHYVYATELIELAKEDHRKNEKLKYKKFGKLLHECLGVVPKCCPSVDDEKDSSNSGDIKDIPSTCDNKDDICSKGGDEDPSSVGTSTTSSINDSLDNHFSTDAIGVISSNETDRIPSYKKNKEHIDKATVLRNSVTKVNNFKSNVSDCRLSDVKCPGNLFLYEYMNEM